LNSANNNPVDSARLLKWISGQKRDFAIGNPRAPSRVIGDLTAAEDEYLDTDRIGATRNSGKMEEDAQ
jgi:hypothetical protein